MNPILHAITSGYSINQILKYLGKSNPDLANKITSALAYGYSANQVLKYVMKGGNDISKFLPKASKSDLSLYDKMQYSIPENVVNAAKTALGATGLGLGYLASKNLSNFTIPQTPTNIQTGTQTPTPGQPHNPPPNSPQTPGQMATPQTPIPGPNVGMQIQQGVQNPINQAMQSQGSANISQAASAIPPSYAPQPSSIFEQITQGVDLNSLDRGKQQQLGFLSMISDQLESQGKTLIDPEFKKLAKKIKDTLAGKPGTVLEESTRGFDVTQAQPELPKIEKSSIVSTPKGVGEVKEIQNGKAIVEVDGKSHKLKESEIESPPIPEKDLADLHQELIQGIEKSTGKQVSRNVNWAGYDPDAKELAYRPWNGDQYIYDNIEPEDVEMLTNFLTQRKTTGNNFIGAWEEGTESPIGAAMHKLVQKLKEKAKSTGKKEYTKKYQTVYSAYEAAEKEAKLKKKLKEQEERKRLRK